MSRPPMPARHVIAQWWIDQPGQRYVVDMGEPSCFACGWWARSAPTYPAVSIETAWARSELDRAHLVPNARGGSADPSNLVLLCRQCHRDAPDWVDPTVMLAWIDARESWVTRDLRRYWPADVPMELPDWLSMDEFNSLFRQALTAGAGTHLAKLSPATIVAAVMTAFDVAGQLYQEKESLP